ncbi:MAG: hypothetical protein ACAH88_10870 [Roseimicrobium sp.]
MSTHIHLLRHPEWTGFQETLMGLDGKSLWLTSEGHRKGPYRIVIVGSGMGSPSCRRYAIELISGMPDESRSFYLAPWVAGHITGMQAGRGKTMELDLDAIVPSMPT